MANRIKWSAKMEKDVCKRIATHGIIKQACAEVGIGTTSFYNRVNSIESFKKMVAEATELGLENQIDECRRRAFEGYDEPVFQGGELVGVKRRFSDVLAMFLIKAKRPEYKEKFIDVNQTNSSFKLDINTDGDDDGDDDGEQE